MDEYLRKRFLADVQYEKYKNKTIQRSLSTESLLGCAPIQELNKNIPNMQELFKISTDILKFRKNAINACKDLLHTFSTDVVPFFNTTQEAVQFLHSLEENWINHWKANITFLYEELKTLKQKYAFNENADIDRLVGSIEELTYSENGSLLEVPPNKIKDYSLSSIISKTKKNRLNKLSLKRRLGKQRDILSDVDENTENNNESIKSMDTEPCDKVPDCAVLTPVNINLNLSSSGNLIIPKPNVLRISYADSQENKHTISKHYVASDECFVKIPRKEKQAVDELLRKKNDSSQCDKKTVSSSTSSFNLTHKSSVNGRKRKLILSSSSSSSDTVLLSNTFDYSTDQICETSYENNPATNTRK